MSTYQVEIPTEGREVYLVEADSPEEAIATWEDGELIVSESFLAGDPVILEVA